MSDDMDSEEQRAALKEVRLLNVSVDRLERTLEDVVYLKDMRIGFLERELGEARDALKDIAEHTGPDAKKSAPAWVLGDKARAALAPKEAGAPFYQDDIDKLNEQHGH